MAPHTPRLIVVGQLVASVRHRRRSRLKEQIIPAFSDAKFISTLPPVWTHRQSILIVKAVNVMHKSVCNSAACRLGV